MRLVVDTNIFVSAALKEASWPANTLRWIGKYGGLIKSDVTEQEVIAVLQRPRLAPKIAPFFLDQLRRVLAAAELVTITERGAACRDPDDDKFLELAINGRADASCQATTICSCWIRFAASRSSRRPPSAVLRCGDADDLRSALRPSDGGIEASLVRRRRSVASPSTPTDPNQAGAYGH
jgi:putative PIN family toxin of toxin-antitoxin system